MTERRLLGIIEVDSGTLLVGDPAYALPYAHAGKPGIDYQAVIDAPSGHAQPLADKLVLLIGDFGGDGAYAVFGEFDEDGLRSVTIDFEPIEV